MRTVNMKSILLPGLIAAFPLLLANPVYSDPPSDVPIVEGMVINSLIGSWSGTGTLMGAPAEFHMQWAWVLGEQFIRLTFENRISRSDGEDFVLSAIGIYQQKDEEKFEGTWFDSRGMVLPLDATIIDSALVTLWGSPETEQGRTVYKVVSIDRIDVEDYVLKDGEWKQFGKAIYRRD